MPAAGRAACDGSLAVRDQQVVRFARHYGVTVHTCEPADPASKGGSESTVKLAKADLVPTDTNLLDAYDTFAELEAACEQFCELVNCPGLRSSPAAGGSRGPWCSRTLRHAWPGRAPRR
jgi:hypothetical protein